MKRLFNVFGNLIALLFLVVAGWFLVRLVQGWSTPNTLQEPDVTSAPAPMVVSTPTPALTWETATLDQIHFGEPKVVLTDTHSLQIVQWVSDEELLILHDLTSNRSKEAIELFNVNTNRVIRLAIGNYLREPIWLPAQQSVAFLTYNSKTKQRDLIISSVDTKTPQILYEGFSLPLLAGADGLGAIAFSKNRKTLLKVEDTQQKVQAIDFSPFVAPSPTPYEWIYKTAQSPNTPWQAVYNIDHFLLINPSNGEIREVQLADKAKVGWNPIWALDARWSPDGQQLAIIATFGELPNRTRFLLLFDIKTDTIRQISIPQEFVLNNLTWAPNNHFLLAQGSVDYIPPGYALQGVILIDTVTQNMNEINLIPEKTLGEGSVAWSPSGKWVAFLCNRLEQNYKTICFSFVGVEK